MTKKDQDAAALPKSSQRKRKTSDQKTQQAPTSDQKTQQAPTRQTPTPDEKTQQTPDADIRQWTEDENAALLRAVLEFRSKNDSLPTSPSDFGIVVETIKESLPPKVTNEEVLNKFGRLRRKYREAVKKNKREIPSYNLLHEVWGKNDGTKKGDVVVKHAFYPFLHNEITKHLKMNEMPEKMVESILKVANPEEAQALEGKLRQHYVAEMALQAERHKLTNEVFTMLGIPGDGRCLFRSVAHGAYLRAGKPSPSESLQKQLADELRSKVADEFVRRRADTEWFLEGDFDTYVAQIRQTHIWGGEPELLMSSHVLRAPITVYMCTEGYDGLKIIAEYGQEYGKEDPIRVLYHGYGHYDALQIPLARTQSKLYMKR